MTHLDGDGIIQYYTGVGMRPGEISFCPSAEAIIAAAKGLEEAAVAANHQNLDWQNRDAALAVAVIA